jgi:hypothetical protein
MRVSIRHIQETVAADFGVPAQAMNAPRPVGRKARQNCRPVSHARQCAMLLARELTPHSLPVIGKLFHRDHTTIIHGINAAERRLAADRNLALKLEARALLLQCEPPKTVDARFIGFPAKTQDESHTFQQLIHSPAIFNPVAHEPALAA